MQINTAMKTLLQTYSIDDIDSVPHHASLPIWQKRDASGRAYWGVSSFWGLDTDVISPDCDLSLLEWDGNEVFFDATPENGVAEILKAAIGTLRFWERELETNYPDTPFYLLASYDNGEAAILDEGETPIPSITCRFWADRGGNRVIDLLDFDEWEQPTILELCNVSTS